MRANLFSLGSAAMAPPALKLLRSGQLSIAELRAMRPLPENAQKLIDDAVIRVGLDRLAVVADLLSEGLTFDLGQEFWGITDLQWDMMNEVGSAKRTMEPLARGEKQIVERTPGHVPVYLTWDDFELGIRTIGAGQRSGQPLDTTMVEQATRRVNEALEDAAINGAGITVAGGTTPGLLTAPNANSFTYTGTGGQTAWDHANKTGAQVVDDVIGMADTLRTHRRFGPYALYVNTSYGNSLNKNFDTSQAITRRQRLEQMVFGGRNLRVVDADQLPANRTSLVQLTSDVVDVVVGQQPTVVSWDHPSGWATNWVVLACLVPRVKTDSASRSGICNGNV